jgi:hypothetical protein
MRRRRALAPLVVALALALAGCATARGPSRPAAPSGTQGRVLVVPRQAAPENHGIATRAAALFAQGLRAGGEVWSIEDLLRESAAAGTDGWAVRLVDRLSFGGWPGVDDRSELLRLGLTGMVTIEVTEYDQVWGRYAKFTRAAVEAQAFDVASGTHLWRLHRATEVEDLRGRAFERALEGAVGDLVAAVQPRGGVSVVELWRWWRR